MPSATSPYQLPAGPQAGTDARAPGALKGAMLPPSALPMHIALPPPNISFSPAPGSAPTSPGVNPSSNLSYLGCFPAPSPGALAPPPPTPQTGMPESPLALARRAPPVARAPPMRVHSTQGQHTLAVRLPAAMGLSPEMVTVSAKRGARLAVVADLWHLESDSHYEWEVVFAPGDVDMLSVRAVFEADGQLLIHVRRRLGAAGSGLAEPQVCVCACACPPPPPPPPSTPA